MVAKLVSRYSSIVVLEDLNHLRSRVNGSSSFNKRLSLWFYGRLQFTMVYEALERGLDVKHVNPRGTSSRCPRCGAGYSTALAVASLETETWLHV